MMKKMCALLIAIICLSIVFPAFASAAPPYESYTYDYWGNILYAPYAYLPDRVIDGSSLGIGDFNTPGDLFVGKDGKIYIADSGNNRIIVADSKWNVLNEIKVFEHDGASDTFKNPQGLYVTEEGHIYVADTDNGRIVELGTAGEFIRQIGAPKADIIPADFVYKPMKLVLDKAKRIYVIAQNVNQGIIELNADGTFQGYMGASRVIPNMIDYIWKMISTREQRAGMVLFMPTEYNNIYIDDEGFLYVTTSALNDADIQNAINFDVSVDSASGIYSVLDRKRGRIFTYDDDGNLLYIFGGIGEQAGTFKSPTAIERIGNQILVLDSKLNSVTAFSITEYGSLVNEALSLHHKGHYDEAADRWQQVLHYNSNYELAYIGLGKSLLRQDRFAEAMKNFKLGNKRDLYSKAFQYYRKEVVEQNFGWIVGGIALAIIAMWLISKYKNKIFKKGNKLLDSLGYSFHVIFHPFDGFWDLKHEKRGSLSAAFIIIILLIVTFVLRRQLTGFAFNTNNPKTLNIFTEIFSVVIPYGLWCVANWCLTTLMDGEGSFTDIVIATAYATVPLILINLPLIPFSHIITAEEGAFYTFFAQLAVFWCGLLIVLGTMVTHQYTIGKTIGTSLLTIVGMGIIIFIGLLVFDLLQQMITFVYTIYREITFRI
ncbi:YIP1 family protein [Mahella sp.]|uniref:YIP1 family protein n=1 Tax=Mahella sp. TaxID=2798721 RepID=UPI0025BC5A19|nr:YIP1 family protein [Mahella sp.]MBZ4666698.1 repeat containing protein [Mahella sp.]